MTFKLMYLPAALLLAGAAPAFAASGVDLSVKGLITPVACTPVLSRGGSVDYGKISAQDLNPTGRTWLRKERVQLTVNCDAQTTMAVKATDNRRDSSTSLGYYGLGLAAGGEKIGGYQLTTEHAKGDGVPHPVIERSIDSNGWMEADDTAWQHGWERTLNAGRYVPLPMQVFQADIVIAPWISDKSYLPITSEIEMDGSVTFTVIYL